MVCHLYGTGRGVTTDNFFTSCELANLLLTKKMTVVGTLRKNKPEITALFLSRETKRCPFFYLRFYLWSNTGIICTSKNHPPFIRASWWHVHGRGRDHKSEMIMNVTKNGVEVLDKLVREYILMKSTRCWPLELFLNLSDVACVNAFVLQMMKYPIGNKKRVIKDACICFLWKKKW